MSGLSAARRQRRRGAEVTLRACQQSPGAPKHSDSSAGMFDSSSQAVWVRRQQREVFLLTLLNTPPRPSEGSGAGRAAPALGRGGFPVPWCLGNLPTPQLLPDPSSPFPPAPWWFPRDAQVNWSRKQFIFPFSRLFCPKPTVRCYGIHRTGGAECLSPLAFKMPLLGNPLSFQRLRSENSSETAASRAGWGWWATAGEGASRLLPLAEGELASCPAAGWLWFALVGLWFGFSQRGAVTARRALELCLRTGCEQVFLFKQLWVVWFFGLGFFGGCLFLQSNSQSCYQLEYKQTHKINVRLKSQRLVLGKSRESKDSGFSSLRETWTDHMLCQ